MQRFTAFKTINFLLLFLSFVFAGLLISTISVALAFGGNHDTPLGDSCTNDVECIVGAKCDEQTNKCVVADMNHPPDLCKDGIQDYQETDIDCGGPNCSACLEEGKKCLEDRDCLVARCKNNRCSSPDKDAKGSCAAGASPDDVKQLKGLNADISTVTCQKVDPKTADNNFGCVVSSDCQAGYRCCIPGAGGAGGNVGGKGSTGGKPSAGTLSLPSCKETGKCQLDDIIRAGVNFASFLFGLSGAIFLAIFVYAGLLYILAGGNGANTKKGKEMMVRAVIGMLIIFGAGTIVRFIYTSFTKQTAEVTQCERDYGSKGYSCQVIGDGSKEELKQRGCITSKGGADSLCRSSGQGENVFCCPLDAPEPEVDKSTTK